MAHPKHSCGPAPHTDAVAVQLEHISVAYGGNTVLDDITLDIPAAEIVGLIGPNGAGKTTLLRTIVGAMRPRRGSVRVLGAGIAGVRQRVAYVPQRGDVDWSFPLSVLDVVLMGRYGRLGIWRRPGKQDRE